jgi:hypothetical protein
MVFGTYRQPERIKVPAKLAMGWLLSENGDIRSEFSEDYFMAGRKLNTGSVIVGPKDASLAA